MQETDCTMRGFLLAALGVMLVTVPAGGTPRPFSLPEGSVRTIDDAASHTETLPQMVALRQLTQKEEALFLDLVQRRFTILEDIRVLNRIRNENIEQKARIVEHLQRRFGISMDEYRLDADTHIIYKRVPSRHDSQPQIQEIFHRQLDASQAKHLLLLSRAKDTIVGIIQSLEIIDQQKQRQWQHIGDRLSKDFGIDMSLDYHYDRDSQTIYRYMPRQKQDP